MKSSAIPYLISSLIAAETDEVVINTVFELVQPEDIGSEYGALYKMLRQCWAKHHLIEPIALFTLIKQTYDKQSHLDKLEKQFSDVWDLVSLPSFWQHYLKLSLAEIKINKLKAIGESVSSKELSVNEIDNALEQAKQQIETIANKYKLDAPRDINTIAMDYLSYVDAEASGLNPSRIKTGLYFEKYTKGFRSGDYVVLAGRPKMGKSAIATTITCRALEHGKRVMFINNEMDEQSMMNRIISCRYQFPIGKLQEPQTMTDDEMAQVMQYIDDVKQLKLELYCFKFQTISQISAELRRLREIGKPVDLVVLDYLQLFATGETHKSRYEEISALSWHTKMLAANNNVPVLALSQLNRKCEERTNKRPVISDLRDSGSIEQDATSVMLIYRDEVYNENTNDIGIAEINVAANRNGRTGTDRYYVDFATMLFANVEYQ